MPANFYLNPILDEKSLEEIYNVGDYPPLDYTYDNYDGDDVKPKKSNDTASPVTGNIVEGNNFATRTDQENATSDMTVAFTADDDSNETVFTDLSEKMNVTSSTDVSLDESTIHDENTTGINYDTSASTIADDFNETSIITDTTLSSSTTESNTFDEYSMFTTLNTSTESTAIISEVAEEYSTEIAEETTADTSPTSLQENAIPLCEENYVVKCFEQVCTTTTQDTSENIEIDISVSSLCMNNR